MDHPRAGTHYPRSVGELHAWFWTDAGCLEWLRWPAGFVCSGCGHAGGWRLGDGRFECARCQARTSMTAGTIFDRTLTPLTVWFTACWLFAAGKDGIFALSLQRALEAQRGKKVLTCIAVEVRELKGLGRCRMAPLADASATSLHAFVTDHVEPRATVITDAWQGYCGLDKLGYVHDRRSQRAARARGEDPGELLPAVHRVASLVKWWLLGTHRGAVEQAHLISYLNEFVFRFNRRRSRSRGLVFYRVLELAVAHQPVLYQDLIASKRPRTVPPPAPTGAGIRRVWSVLQQTVRGEPPTSLRLPEVGLSRVFNVDHVWVRR